MVTVPVVGDQRAQALGEVDDVGHVGEDVVGDDQVGLAVPGRDVLCRSPRRGTSTSVGMPFSTAASATFAAGSMPSAADAPRDDVLQQVAVVAGHLDDEGVRRPGRAGRRRASTNASACATQESLYEEK